MPLGNRGSRTLLASFAISARPEALTMSTTDCRRLKPTESGGVCLIVAAAADDFGVGRASAAGISDEPAVVVMTKSVVAIGTVEKLASGRVACRTRLLTAPADARASGLPDAPDA